MTNDWKEIHPDFASGGWSQSWEASGLTSQETKEWIEIGFLPKDYEAVKKWKDYDFASQQVKEWINKGLKNWEYELAYYLQKEGYQTFSNELREQYKSWLKTLTAQQWIDYFYPLAKRSRVTSLNLGGKGLVGSLDLTGFVNLEYFYCPSSKLTSLDVSNNLKLKDLECAGSKKLVDLKLGLNKYLSNIKCWDCQLTNLDLRKCEALRMFWVSNNQIVDLLFPQKGEKLSFLRLESNKLRDLSIFSHLENLEQLWLENNPLSGSFEALQDCSKLKELKIEHTDINEGLEYLSPSLETLYCTGKLAEQLSDYAKEDPWKRNCYDYQAWRKNHAEKIDLLRNPEKFNNLRKKLVETQTQFRYSQDELSNEKNKNFLLNKEIFELKKTELLKEKSARFQINYNNSFVLLDEEEKSILNELLKELAEIVSNAEEDNPYAQKLIKNQKRTLHKKLEVNALEELCKLKTEIVKLEKQLTNLEAQNWVNIHFSFVPELIQTWQNAGFTYPQVKDWANVFGEHHFNPSEVEFIAWLRDIKHLTPEKALNHGNLSALRAEYQTSQQNAYITHANNC